MAAGQMSSQKKQYSGHSEVNKLKVKATFKGQGKKNKQKNLVPQVGAHGVIWLCTYVNIFTRASFPDYA